MTEIEKIVGACNELLNGKNSVTVTLTAEYQFLISIDSKIEASNQGFLIRHDTKNNQITVKLIENATKKTTVVTATPVEATLPPVDPNVPFSDYLAPKIIDDIIALITSPKTSNAWLFGPTQSGKSRAVHYIGYKLGRKIHQVNCVGNMDTHHFFGRNTVVIDPATKQNVIKFIPGVVEKSMVEGLDENGKVVGPAGILFIDEAAAMPTEIGIGLNRVLECTHNERILTIEEDGNRTVKSHPEWRIILAGNTNGTGANDMASQIYTAQQCALDASLIQRMTAVFRFGYDKKAEETIIRRACSDQALINIFLQFKQGIRDALKRDNGELTTPFSTKKVIDIFDMYQVFLKQFKGNSSIIGKQALGKAIYFASYELLAKEEQKKYDELWYPLTKDNINRWAPSSSLSGDTDYM